MIISTLSLLTVKPACAQTVPEFAIALADHSYQVPPITTTDPYTGKSTTQPGYTVENKTIDVTIKNQPFETNLYYNVRSKGHFGNAWTELYTISNNTLENTLIAESTSEYTNISIPQDNYPAGSQVDFQIEAVIATSNRLANTPFGFWSWTTSGWSPTQTVTIPSPTPTSTSAVPEIPTSALLPLILFIFSVAVIVRHRKIAN
ncbi:MAG TPA: hypothetical protein VJY36_01215 [Candidatus Bathyarchaeia archaeon]|nr:hypothetical protein [Candidatus Bathyarchaeia archaeon]